MVHPHGTPLSRRRWCSARFNQKGKTKVLYLSLFGQFWTLPDSKLHFGTKWHFGLYFCFLTVCDTRWQSEVRIRQTLEIFSAKHLPRQLFPKLTFEFLLKPPSTTKIVIFNNLASKICDVKVSDSKISFCARDFTLPTESAKSTEKFRVSPLAAAAARERIILKIIFDTVAFGDQAGNSTGPPKIGARSTVCHASVKINLKIKFIINLTNVEFWSNL